MRNSTLIVCGTIVVVALIAAFTLLVVAGHDSDIRALILLVGPYVSGLITSYAVNRQGKKTEDTVQHVKEEIKATVANGMPHSSDGTP